MYTIFHSWDVFEPFIQHGTPISLMDSIFEFIVPISNHLIDFLYLFWILLLAIRLCFSPPFNTIFVIIPFQEFTIQVVQKEYRRRISPSINCCVYLCVKRNGIFSQKTTSTTINEKKLRN